jgi:hypothetical protein
MTEPKRWLEDGPPEAIARVLSAARSEQPGEAGLRRTLASVGVGIAGAAATGKAAAVGISSSSTLLSGAKVLALVKWGAAGVVVTAAVVGAVAIARTFAPSSQTARVERALPSAAIAPSAPVLASPAITPAAEAIPSAANEGQAARRDMAASRPSAAARTPPREILDAEQLQEERRLLDRAHSRLVAGRPSETLSAVDQYQARFTNPALLPEALYLRMEAVLVLGRKTEARRLAERIVASYPDGPHAARARSVVEQTIP